MQHDYYSFMLEMFYLKQNIADIAILSQKPNSEIVLVKTSRLGLSEGPCLVASFTNVRTPW